MKVSIITSCYNREATIRGAIESVLGTGLSLHRIHCGGWSFER